MPTCTSGHQPELLTERLAAQLAGQLAAASSPRGEVNR
jgi:hypothetical protein